MAGPWPRRMGYMVVAATAVLAVILASRFGSDPGFIDSPLLGNAAPEFSLETLDGDESVRLSDMRGDIVVINFFAGWCLECRKEHPDLIAVADAFAGAGVRFVGISYQETVAESLSFLAELGRSPDTLYLADPGSRTAIAYGVFGIPETFFVSPDGNVVAKIVGESNAAILGATIDAIRRGEDPGQQVTGDTQQRPDS